MASVAAVGLIGISTALDDDPLRRWWGDGDDGWHSIEETSADASRVDSGPGKRGRSMRMPIVAVPVAERSADANPSVFRTGSPILIVLLAVALAPMLFLNYVGQQNTKDRLTDLSVADPTMR